MLAAWYERHGPARKVLQFGEMATPEPRPGEVRVKVAASVVHVSDLGKRAGAFGSEMPFPRVIPQDRKSTRLNSSHIQKSRMPSSA